MSAKRDLKAFVRLDSSNRVVPGSLIFRKHKPKEGRFMEIVIDPCCGTGVSAILVDNNGTVDALVNGVNVASGTTKIILPKFGLKLFNLSITPGGVDLDYTFQDESDATVGTSGVISNGVKTEIEIDQTIQIVKITLVDD